MSIMIKNFSYQINDTLLFDNISFNVNEGEFVNIIGKSKCGKSTLSKILTGKILLNVSNTITVDNMNLSEKNFFYLRNHISFIPDNINDIFLHNTVYEEITFILKNLNYPHKQISQLVDEYVNLFNIKDIINRSIISLSGGEKYKVALISNIIHNPKYLIIDSDLSMLDNNTREEIYNILLKINYEKKVSIINMIKDLDWITFYGRNIVIHNKSIIVDVFGEDLFKNDKLLNDYDFKFKDIIDLSYKLKLYNLVSKLHIKTEDLVEDLWK